MITPREVLLAGWTGDPPRLAGYTLKPVAVGDIRSALGRARRGTILVLGEEALRLLEPDSLRHMLFKRRCVAFGVYRELPPEEALAWSRSRVVDVLPERLLLSRVRQESRILRRTAVPPEEWAPRVPEPETLAARALWVLPFLPRPLVGELAKALEVERHVLLRECRMAFGITAEELCWRYVDGYVRQERRRGVSLSLIAFRLGYADPRSLWRKYRELGLQVPAAGPGKG